MGNMIIIIDGYNLLKQRDAGAYIEDVARDRLIRQLEAYHTKKGHAVFLIFDGGVHSWLAREQKSGVVVIYVGRGKSADDYIKNYISEHYKDDLFLVSSDRELGRWACKHGVVSMDSLLFFDIMLGALVRQDYPKRESGVVVKTTEFVDASLDLLMEQVSMSGYDKGDTCKVQNRSVISGKAESKVERMLRKKIEKL
jgi:predicted RNA-binding protein with PIN domain